METRLRESLRNTPTGQTAEEILRACVHCGFCLATCPTYQLLGDELDGPRGRIYQIKQVLEGSPATRETQLHLDRCLTCRSCETTCPSGVQYGHLVDIGRAEVAEQVRRPLGERVLRWILREGLTRRWLFGGVLGAARSVRWLLPRNLRAKVGLPRAGGLIPTRAHGRKVLLLNACIQPSLLPSIDASTARVLDALGIQAIVEPRSGCCGAIRHHLDDQEGARDNARRNIDAWWPLIDTGKVEAILVNASGCAAMVKDYGHHLREDPRYADRAARIVEMTRDPAEYLGKELRVAGKNIPPAPSGQAPHRVAFQAPCTLQHGLKIRGEVEALLGELGAEVVPVQDAHLCCGSAGTYSLLQGSIAGTLRARKLQSLLVHRPEAILSANIGCIAHLQVATQTPVRHWIEWVDQILVNGCRKQARNG